MSIHLFENLENYAQRAVKAALHKIDLSEVCFDHICYQTKSTEEYRSTLKSAKDKIEVIEQRPHSGREITIANLKNPLSIDGVKVDKLEISEPKPKRQVKENNFDHIAFAVRSSFEDFVNKLKNSEVEIVEEKQIHKDKLVKFIVNDIEVEIRNNKIGERQCQTDIEEKETTQEKKNMTESGPNETEKLKKQLKEETDKKLRALADYQNLLKRVEKEKQSTTLLASINILGSILETIDDFDRALDNLKIEEKDQVGFRMVRQKLQDIVDTYGLVEIECQVGETFNPQYCEAVGVVAVESDKENNTVQQIVQKGYKMKEGEIVVRPTRVIVGKKGEDESKNEE